MIKSLIRDNKTNATNAVAIQQQRQEQQRQRRQHPWNNSFIWIRSNLNMTETTRRMCCGCLPHIVLHSRPYLGFLLTFKPNMATTTETNLQKIIKLEVEKSREGRNNSVLNPTFFLFKYIHASHKWQHQFPAVLLFVHCWLSRGAMFREGLLWSCFPRTVTRVHYRAKKNE